MTLPDVFWLWSYYYLLKHPIWDLEQSEIIWQRWRKICMIIICNLILLRAKCALVGRQPTRSVDHVRATGSASWWYHQTIVKGYVQTCQALVGTADPSRASSSRSPFRREVKLNEMISFVNLELGIVKYKVSRAVLSRRAREGLNRQVQTLREHSHIT